MSSRATNVEVLISLDERRERIIAHVEKAALDVGAELLAAKADHPGRFLDWVATSLPFGVDKAEKLMAITRAFGAADEATRRALPPAWTAMFELSRLPIETVQTSIESGEIHTQMTVADARELVSGHRDPPKQLPPRPKGGPKPGFDPNVRIGADQLARELLRCRRDDLSDALATQIRAWLGPEPPEETP